MPVATKASDSGRPAAADIADIISRARAGDESSRPALRKALAGDAELVDSLGDMAAQVAANLIQNAAGKNISFLEALTAKVAGLRRDLAGVNPTPLEDLLAHRIALCWLTLHEVEVRYHQAKDLSMRQSEHWQRRIDSSHRRYLSAIKTLATVRKLEVPALQVNIAKKQVNILTGAAE